MRKRIHNNASLRERLFFRRRIDLNTNCWLWTGRCDFRGYGQIKYKGKVQRVHRLSYEVFIKIPIYQVLHKQNCPNKNCFNPDHLYDGTPFDNVQDSIKAGTHKTSWWRK